MTKDDAAKYIGIKGQTYDYALPETWVDSIVGLTGHTGSAICGNLVWLYDEANRTFGRPCALTTDGNKIIEDVNSACGTHWPLTENPVPSNATD
jgi:hypothetical protein